jgi:methionyl-tRNA formyltransferase
MVKSKVAFLFSQTNDWIAQHIRHADFDKYWPGSINFFYDKDLISGYDIVFILGYTEILDIHFLERNKFNFVVHESALPFGKGFSPIQWQILSGAEDILVTLLEASEIVDSGDIILQEKLTFDGSELYDEIRNKQAACTISLIKTFLVEYPVFIRKKQLGDGSTFPRRTPKDNRLCLDKNIKEQFNLLRIGNNEEWPSYFNYKGNKYILKIYKDN